jgi:glucose-1-phosphate thymidylyltransferase
VLLKTVMMVSSERSQLAGRRSEPRLTALEHVANRPLIHHVLDGLSEVSTDGLIVVGGTDALRQVKASLSQYGHPLGSVDYVASPEPSDVGMSLAEVAPIVGDAACIVHPADGLLSSSTATFASMCEDEDLDLVLVLAEPSDGAKMDDWETYRRPVATAIRESSEEAEIAVLGPGMLASAARNGSLHQESRSLSKVGRSLAACGASVEVKTVGGWYRYSGQGRELLDLNRITLDRTVSDVPAEVRRNNRIEGQVRVDATAIVRSSVIVGPSIVGPGAVISDSYIGPYTAIGARARIEGAEIERSIVSPGASVLHIGSRMVSSLVGRDTRVSRDFALPRALRLWIGDGNDVALC